MDALLLQDPWAIGIAVYLVAALNWGVFFRIEGRLRESLVSAVLLLAGLGFVLFVIPPVRIAKETTFLTEPKTADGTRIDYDRAIAEQNTTKNDTIFAPDPKYRSAESFFSDHREEIAPDSSIRLLNRLMESPWTDSDSPVAKRWLEQSGPTLDRLAEAVRRENFAFAPSDSSRIPVSWGRDFRVRIQYELGRNEPEKAWDDVLTLFRLSQHLGRQSFDTASFFSAQVVWGDAYGSAVAVVKLGGFSAETLTNKLAELDPFLRPFTKETGKAIIDTERLAILSRIQATAWGDHSEFSLPFFKRFFRFFYWNETLQKINSYFDWIEVLETPNYSFASRFPIRENPSEWNTILKLGIFRAVPDKKGLLEIHVWNDRVRFLEQQLRILRAKSALLQSVFYLEMYRDGHGGKYPESWAALKEQFGDKIPDDPCSLVRSGDRSLKYEPLENGAEYRLYSVGPNGIDENGASWKEKKGCDDILAGN